ncbi:beta strand repeat-containing protein, partial [Aquimarina litoralis]|uniref:beta strand repeat-containing protein n=1 Tax=Aquimarina litoralis TaxID=584605 RepID=UPI001C59A8E1
MLSFISYGQVRDGVIDDPGDIAFVAYNNDDDGFSFVFLDDCPDGTTIRFTDEEWTGTAFSTPDGEGEVLWTNNTGGIIAIGTVVDITDADDNGTGILASVGTASEVEPGFNTANIDELFAITGTRAVPGTFLSFVGDLTGNSLTGTGLTDGVNANIITQEGYYTGSTTCNSSIGDCAAMINDSNNWTLGDFAFPTIVPDTFDGSALAADTENPRIQSITRQTPTTSPTNADALTFGVEFTEAVVNVSAADFSIGSTTTATITNVADLGSNVWGITISGGDLANFNGTVTLGIVNNQDIEDLAGNELTDTTPIDPFPENFVVDNTPPGVTSIVRQNPTTSPTNADTLVWDVTFDEDVANIGTDDFSVSGTTATITAVTNPTGNTYRITASGGDLANLNGTVTLSFSGGQDITDDIGNVLVNTTPTGTNDNTFLIDNIAPTGYSVSIDQSPINLGNENAVSFTFASAEVGATYNYTFTSSGGAGSVTDSGAIATATDQITGIDLSGLPDGTITLTVTLTDVSGNTGSNATDTESKDTGAPTGYSVSIDQSPINSGNENAVSFTFAGAEVGATYNYTFTSSGGAGSVTDS